MDMLCKFLIQHFLLHSVTLSSQQSEIKGKKINFEMVNDKFIFIVIVQYFSLN